MPTTRGLIAAVAATLLGLSATLAAQAQQASKEAPQHAPVIAVVDVQKVLSEADASRQAKSSIESRRNAYEHELQKQKQQLQAGQDQLQKQSAVLAPDALEQKRRELEQRFNDVRRQTEERRGLLQNAMKDAMDQLRKEMGGAIAEVMKRKGIEMTLPRSAVLVFDNRLDITDDVLASLNKRLPKITLPLN